MHFLFLLLPLIIILCIFLFLSLLSCLFLIMYLYFLRNPLNPLLHIFSPFQFSYTRFTSSEQLGFSEWPFLAGFTLSDGKHSFTLTRCGSMHASDFIDRKGRLGRGGILGDPKLYSIFSLLVLVVTVLFTSGKHRSWMEQRSGKG